MRFVALNSVQPTRRRLIAQSDRVLVALSLWTLLASVSLPVVIVLEWPSLLRVFGVFGLFAAPGYLLLALWKLLRYGNEWRSLVASVVLALATLIAWGTIYLYVTGQLH